jgi:uncharacterized pyridoxamine 5'-phosphate oxidase family protein
MSRDLILKFLKSHKLAVISTVSKDNKPQSAVIGIAVSDRFELIFDTVKTSRKYDNIAQNPFVSLVVGWDQETTVQYEGIATELAVGEAAFYKEIYFSVFSDGMLRDQTLPNIVHYKITPKWLRYSNFNEPVSIEEISESFY